MTNPSALELLQQIAREVKTCTLCDLQYSRMKAVPGYGQSKAEILFIAEAPNYFENEEGLPLLGPAGLLLDELLQKANMHRKQVFITNMVKCRPPSNRDPAPVEVTACAGFLERQIQAIRPKVIVTLGRTSMQRYWPNANLSDMHGIAVQKNGQLIVPFYHPAAALNKPSLQPILEADFAKLPGWIDNNYDLPGSDGQTFTKEKDKPEQMSLF